MNSFKEQKKGLSTKQIYSSQKMSSYRDFKQKRPKSSISFHGYSRNLDKNTIKLNKFKFQENVDALSNLFDVMQNEVDAFLKKEKASTPQPGAKRVQSSVPNKVKQVLTIDLNPNGESSIALTAPNANNKSRAQQKSVKIENQIANYDLFEAIKSKLERKLSNAESDEEKVDIEERIKNINGYLELIKFCFKYLGKSGDDVKDVKSDFFQVVSKDPIEVTIENSDIKYSIEEILTKYFKSLFNSANQENPKIECNDIVIATPPEYGLFEKSELKNSIENSGLNLLRIVSKPVAKVMATISEEDENKTNNKNMLIDFNSGPLTVTLYETNNNKKTKILSTLTEGTVKTENLNELNENILKKKLSDKVDMKTLDKTIQKYIDEIEQQFKNGAQIAILKIGDEKIEISRNEVEGKLKNFIEKADSLIKAILHEQNLDINDLSVVNHCSFNFDYLIGEIFKKHFPNARPTLFHGEKEISALEGIGVIANKIASTGKDCIDNTLSCNLGVGEFRGVFVKQLLRGANLPCSNNVTLNTVIDYQQMCTIEIFQGERLFSRYCNLLGTLTVNDLPIDKAYKVAIDVVLSIDKDEVLTVKANEVRTNKKLSVVIEKGKMKNDKGVNMVLDALENKDADEKLVKKLDDLNNLIQNARKTYKGTEHENDVFSKINETVSWITERKYTIDVAQCEDCVNNIRKFFMEQNLELN